ncbi:MAG: TatD family hydrolase [Spirochaetales bacterium]|nr:TatD family hydrolase [Spirochaetales bacterium]
MDNYKDINLLPGMTDSHFHIMEMIRKGMDPEILFSILKEKSAGDILDAAVVVDDFDERLKWRDRYERLWFSAGIHPNIPLSECPEDFEAILETQVSHPLVKAVGETGLDFFREYSSPEDQYRLLDLHYKLSLEADKPLIFHIRNAEREMEEWLKERDFPQGAILHCFPGGISLAEAALARGFYISFAGNVTFKNAQEIREALAVVPTDRLLLETDAPYLAPHPKRGRNNHPAMIGWTYELAAEEKKISLQDLVDICSENLKKVLRLD